MGEILLQGTLQQFPECKQFYDVKLTRSQIVIDEINDNNSFGVRRLQGSCVSLKDVVNVKVLETKFRKDISVVFQVIQYVKGKKRKERIRQDVSFRITEGNAEENKLTAQLWSRTILWLLRDPAMDTLTLQAREYYPPVKKYLVLVNPKSGRGKSVGLYKKKVEPMLKAADVEYEEIITDYSGQAHEIAKTLDLDRYDCILICSGDGLGNEVVNGFMKRYDWEVAIKTPIAFVPTGSGNGMVVSLAKSLGEETDIVSSVYIALRGKPIPLNLCSFEIYNQRIYGFLSLTWGLLSDVDIESEKWRALGNLRFTVGAMVKIFSLQKYRGKLSILPHDSETLPCEGTKKDTLTHNYENGHRDMTSHAEEAASAGASNSLLLVSDTDNERHDLSPDSTTSPNVHAMASNSFKLSAIDLNGATESTLNNYREKRVNEEQPGASNRMHEQLDYCGPNRGPINHLLPQIPSAVPDNWVVIPGGYVYAVVSLVSDLGPGLSFVPDMPFGDDGMYLLYSSDDATRKSVLGMFLALEDGEHLKFPECKIMKIKAFRLEPDLAVVGHLAVDGELIEYGCLQGQFHKGLGRIYSL